MTEIKKQYYGALVDRGGALSISSKSFYECEFSNCALSLTTQVDRISTVSDVLIKNCTVWASDVGPAVLRRVHVDGLITDSLFIVWGALFDQVVFSGKIGKIKINRYVHHVEQSEFVQAPFDLARRSFYDKVDWAIDISQAKFRSLNITGIPSRLIRRDPVSQMVVTRESAMRTSWRSKLSADNKHWPFVIDMFLATGEEDEVLVAPLNGPKKQTEKLLRDLLELRDLGVVS
jgi:hypothetical protein